MRIHRLILVVIPWIVSEGSPTISRCVTDQDKIQIIKCPEGQKIQVKELIFGLDPFGACGYKTVYCTETFDEVKDTCCGQTSCPILVKKFYSQKCQDDVNFFRLVYECLSENKSLCTEIQGEILTTTSTATTAVTNNSQNNITHVWRSKSYVTMETSSSNNNGKELLVSVGSGAAMAVLLMAIITVLFLLRRFSWDDEKYCIMGLLIPKCLQRPPNRNADGSENPEDTKISSRCRMNEEGNGNSGCNIIDPSENVGILSEINRNGKETVAEKQNLESSFKINTHVQFIKLDNNQQILMKPNKDRRIYESRKRKTLFNDSRFISNLEVINEDESSPNLSTRKPRKHLKPRSRKQNQIENSFEPSIKSTSGTHKCSQRIENKFQLKPSYAASGKIDYPTHASKKYRLDTHQTEQTTADEKPGSLQLLSQPAVDIESRVAKSCTYHRMNICHNSATKEVDDQDNHCVCFYIHDGVGVSEH